MNDQTQRPRMAPVALQTAEEATAEVRAGNVHDLEVVLEDMRGRIEDYVAKRDRRREQP